MNANLQGDTILVRCSWLQWSRTTQGDARACRLLLLDKNCDRTIGFRLAVRHPDFQFVSESTEQAIYMHCGSFMLLDIDLCVPIFPFLSCHYISSVVPGNGLQPVANAENWNVEFKDPT